MSRPSINPAVNVSCVQVYAGGMPSFEAVDGSGIAVMSKVLGTDPTPARSGDGGFGSIGDVLLKTSKATGVFRCLACHSTFKDSLLWLVPAWQAQVICQCGSVGVACSKQHSVITEL